MLDVRLLTEPFIPGVFIGPFTNAHPGLGGVCTFVGEVRGGGGVEALELSHYEPLTLPGMRALAQTASSRFGLMGMLMLHRVGTMYPGEPIVCVSAAAEHRRAAIDAVDFAMDHLKSDSWFWKRELRGGVWNWIEPRDQDHADLRRWG
ncbi:molybdenum cofactor biosynthesis protein MoaE [Novosphingobium ginsenosidimutans]|uniref:Molybdopterin synthase catalytic subunit n=1 Tax=Novosphingobium ginsenosidimutans TaxID=1176536 RepID=A0A5B8S2X1_9SPHN|nr:molybdenum cofactor biosynthesis protein MoaE [Novosphingobium ginsenosidimutans]QEA15077.1 molybdenum cofactor biosynthesis protein MoaE [Novosphingobium ginsenosidimutans]